jgi:hypothetical protein
MRALKGRGRGGGGGAVVGELAKGHTIMIVTFDFSRGINLAPPLSFMSFCDTIPHSVVCATTAHRGHCSPIDGVLALIIVPLRRKGPQSCILQTGFSSVMKNLC